MPCEKHNASDMNHKKIAEMSQSYVVKATGNKLLIALAAIVCLSSWLSSWLSSLVEPGSSQK